MREILFRGKLLCNGEWAFGNLDIKPNDVYIITPDDTPIGKYGAVDPTTVGQFTGIKDKNGRKIFEGDIVRLHYFFENFDAETLGVFEDERVITAEIKITQFGVLFESKEENGYLCGYLCDYLEEPEEELEVIGNIYDNPELLNGRKENHETD